MSNHAQDRRDRIFGDDDLLTQLYRRKAALLDEIEQQFGVEARQKLCDPVSGCAPTAASPLLDEYRRINDELARRNSRRCSQELTRFLSVTDDESGQEEMTAEIRSWWLNRY